MKCELLWSRAVSYLENELSQDEKALFEKHITQCDECRLALNELTKTRNLTVKTLQSLAGTAQPSPQAWSQLQAVIGSNTQKEKHWLHKLIFNLAPGWESIKIKQFSGERMMSRKIVIPVLGAIVLAAFGFFFVSQNTKPVSAKQILEKAYEVQKAQRTGSGISHIQAESFYNPEASIDEQAGTRTIFDNYYDLQTGNLRNVITNIASGKIIEVFGYDGKNTYSSRYTDGKQNDEPLIVYRSPQSRDAVADMYPQGTSFSAEEMFNVMRSDPNITLESKEATRDGKSVYVLLSNQPVKMINSGAVELQPGISRMVFDAKTYQLLETQSSIQNNGKEVLVNSLKYIHNEILPADHPVVWDMSDLQGIKLVDDLDRTMGALLPEKMSETDLATKTNSAYLLKSIPDGFDLEISVPPNQKNEATFIYVASYRNSSGDYFVIQTGGVAYLSENIDETYTTQNGLIVTFIKESENNPDGKIYQMAVVTATDGYSFLISSSLPRERVKELMETLSKPR